MSWVRTGLVPALKNAGLRVILDVDDFVPGRDLMLEMSRAGQTSRRAICVLSPAYFDGERMVHFESLNARRSDPAGTQSRLIPLILRQTALPDWLAGLIPIDWTGQQDHLREWRKLLSALEARRDSAPPPPIEKTRTVTWIDRARSILPSWFVGFLHELRRPWSWAGGGLVGLARFVEFASRPQGDMLRLYYLPLWVAVMSIVGGLVAAVVRAVWPRWRITPMGEFVLGAVVSAVLLLLLASSGG